MRDVQTIVTHSGTFHADEVTAIAILKTLYPRAEVIRTRDPEITETPDPEGGKVILDVGGRYSGRDLMFDHHQPGAEKRLNDITYSACGLIWRHFGRDYLRHLVQEDHLIERIWREVDFGIITNIDAGDNGELGPALGPMHMAERSYTLPALIGKLAPASPTATEADFDHAFGVATAMVGTLFEGIVEHATARLQNEAMLEAAIAEQRGQQILVLPQYGDPDALIRAAEADEFLFYTFPDRNGGYCLRGIAVAPGDYTLRKNLPEEWSGLRGKNLDEVTGVPGGVFCHAKLFLAIHETFDGVMALAQQAVEAPEPDEEDDTMSMECS